MNDEIFYELSDHIDVLRICRGKDWTRYEIGRMLNIELRFVNSALIYLWDRNYLKRIEPTSTSTFKWKLTEKGLGAIIDHSLWKTMLEMKNKGPVA